MSDHIPPDIVTEILCRLPVKSLLRFTCVSKPWCSQINGKDFTNLHLNHSMKTNNNVSLIFTNPILQTIHSLDFDSLDTAAIAIQLNEPFKNRLTGPICLVDSCNGLLCYVTMTMTSNDSFALWNPSTRKHRILPNLLRRELQRGLGMDYFFGFGYDHINDDYKVVRVSHFSGVEGKILECEVMVYSLKSDEWKRFKKQTPLSVCHYHKSSKVTFVAGSLHWTLNPNLQHKSTTTISSKDDIIVAFDLGVEDFSEVEQPNYVGNLSCKNLGVLGGCLCVLAYCENVRVDLWVMKEYKVKESWIKLLSIASPGVSVTRSINWSVRPLAYSNKGGGVLFEKEGSNYFWYDLGTKRRKRVKIQNRPNSFAADICHGSLVSLGVNQGTIEEKKKVLAVPKGKKRDDFLSKGFKLVL